MKLLIQQKQQEIVLQNVKSTLNYVRLYLANNYIKVTKNTKSLSGDRA